MKQTPAPQDWHDVGKILGRPPIKLPRPIKARVDTGCLERIKAQIQRDLDAGLLPGVEAPK